MMPLKEFGHFVPVVLTILTLFIVTSCGLGGESNGFGDHIEWMGLTEGLDEAKATNKPLMLIIHKSWCGACKAMKPKFQESKKIGELSKRFVMVNTLDDEEPEGDVYQPDGGYIPRLLFFDPSGELLKDIVNEGGNPDYKYYYNDATSITRSMDNVISRFNGEDGGETEIELDIPEGTPTADESKNQTNRIEL